MKAHAQTPPPISSTVIRLVFLGGVILGCVFGIATLCATALRILE